MVPELVPMVIVISLILVFTWLLIRSFFKATKFAITLAIVGAIGLIIMFSIYKDTVLPVIKQILSYLPF